MKINWVIVALILFISIAVAGFLAYSHRHFLYLVLTSRGFNRHGGDITIINAKIWTGNPKTPWKTSMTVRAGKIIVMNADKPTGEIIDAQGRLIVPGMWDGHCHIQAPYVLTSLEAPSLLRAESVKEIQKILQEYIKKHPEDKFPRLFGWRDHILPKGEKPTRQLIDEVASDRPVYLVHYGGHAHWANTRALELAGALEKDPPDLRGNGVIHRNPITGLATGFLEETEYAATAGLMLNLVKKVKPLSFDEQVLAQRYLLDLYPKVGVTSLWTKDGDLDITRVYEQILRHDSLPVRVVLDNMYTPYSKLSDFGAWKKRADEIKNSNLPKGFLRADGAKIFIDLPIYGWNWFFEPYADDPGNCGRPAYRLEDFQAQLMEADRQGLQINISVYGDRALHESLNFLEEAAKINPPRLRRHMIEHAQYIIDHDLPRFKELDVMVSMNPIVSYPDKEFQTKLRKEIGKKRLNTIFQRYKDLLKAGAVVVNGSDFPIGPFDPLIGIHILVTGTDINGQPKGGMWSKQRLTVEEALRTYTIYPSYVSFTEDHRGQLKEGYDADFVMLSDNILDEKFDLLKLYKVKAVMTVFNGHIVHKDFSPAEKIIEFGE